MIELARTIALTAGLALAVLAAAKPAAAHCDSMDGPVVKAAREALATGQVARALAWVQPAGEAEIRQAFARTVAARAVGGSARELADHWFFETLVRAHRAGEGEPYTGLKPAGWKPPAGIAAADRSLGDGSVSGLAGSAGRELTEAIQARFERVRALQRHAPGDVAAGRRYVAAYVEYIHFIERVQELLHESAGAHAAAEGPVAARAAAGAVVH